MASPQTTPAFALTAVNVAGDTNSITVTDATVYANDTVEIQSFANSTANPGTAVKINSTGHGLNAGETVIIAGSTEGTQNGTFIVSDITAGSYDITLTWTSNGGADATWYLGSISYYTMLFVLIQTSITTAALEDTLITADNASDNLITSWDFDAATDGWYQSFMIPARVYANSIAYAVGEVWYYVARTEFVKCTTAGTADNADPLLSTGAIFEVLAQYETDILHSGVDNSLMDEDVKQCIHTKRVAYIDTVVDASENCDIPCKGLVHVNNLYQTAITDFSRTNYLDAQKNIELLIQLCDNCD